MQRTEPAIAVREDSTQEYCVKCRTAFAYGSLAWLHHNVFCSGRLLRPLKASK